MCVTDIEELSRGSRKPPETPPPTVLRLPSVKRLCATCRQSPHRPDIELGDCLNLVKARNKMPIMTHFRRTK